VKNLKLDQFHVLDPGCYMSSYETQPYLRIEIFCGIHISPPYPNHFYTQIEKIKHTPIRCCHTVSARSFLLLLLFFWLVHLLILDLNKFSALISNFCSLIPYWATLLQLNRIWSIKWEHDCALKVARYLRFCSSTKTFVRPTEERTRVHLNTELEN
jgi:hypothetical protein